MTPRVNATRKAFDKALAEIRPYTSSPSQIIVDTLDKIGLDAITNAFNTKDPKNDTYNQRDAYGYGIYRGNTLVKMGFLEGEKANKLAKGLKQSGRSLAEEMLIGYVPKTDGYTLCLVNAVFYSGIHEARGLKVLFRETERARNAMMNAFQVEINITDMQTTR